MNAPAEDLFTLVSGASDTASRDRARPTTHPLLVVHFRPAARQETGPARVGAARSGLMNPATERADSVEAIAGRLLTETGGDWTAVVTTPSRPPRSAWRAVYELVEGGATNCQARVQAGDGGTGDEHANSRAGRRLSLELGVAPRSQLPRQHVRTEFRTLPLSASSSATPTCWPQVSRRRPAAAGP